MTEPALTGVAERESARATPEETTERGGIAMALTRAAFRNLWLAELLSQTALNAIWFAALVATEQETHSVSKISVTVVSAIVPVALFGLLAGILVDRWDKKRVLVLSNLLRIVIALGYLTYGWSIGIIFTMNFLINAVAQFFSPAMLATIPRLLPKRLLTAATGLFNVTLNISQVLGMVVLGPLLIKLHGPGAVFALAAALYVVATILVVLVPGERQTEPDRRVSGSVLAELRADFVHGWRFVRSDRRSWLALLYLASTWTILFALIILAPRYAAAHSGLRVRADDAIFILAPAGIGMALAAGLLDRLQRRFGRWRLVGISLLALAVALSLLALVAPLANHLVHANLPTHEARHMARPWLLFGRVGVAALIAALAGWWVGIVTVTAEAVLLERAPADLRGRIFALQLTFTNLATILPLLIVGKLADLIGLNQVIALAAVAVLLVWLGTASPFRPLPADQLPTEAPA